MEGSLHVKRRKKKVYRHVVCRMDVSAETTQFVGPGACCFTQTNPMSGPRVVVFRDERTYLFPQFSSRRMEEVPFLTQPIKKEIGFTLWTRLRVIHNLEKDFVCKRNPPEGKYTSLDGDGRPNHFF